MTVTVRGPATVVETLSAPDIVVHLSIEGLTPGIHFLAPVVRVPPGLTVRSVRPEKIKVEIMKRVRE